MGLEGYSKPPHLVSMNQIIGNRGEYLTTLLFFGMLIPLVAMGRKAGEQGIRDEVKTTNRYAKLDLGKDSKLSEWTLGDAS